MPPIVIQFPMNQNPPIVEADISRYNAMILPDGTVISHFDFDKYSKKSRIIILRSSVANAGMDFEYEYNLRTCEQKEIYVEKIYHYTKLWKDINTQATIIKDAFEMAKTLSPKYYMKKIVLDIEENDGLDKNVFTGNAEKLVSKVYAYTGVIPEIYTRAYFWNQNTYIADWMKECALWIAHHFTGMNPYEVPVARPYLPDAWAKIKNPVIPVYWQFDTYDLGFEWGSTGDNEIDLSFFTYKGGTKAAFQELNGIIYPEPAEPPPTPPPAGDDWRVMTVNGMNIRNQPLVADKTLIGKGILNKKVKVVGPADNGYVPVEAWLYEKSLRKL